MNFNNKKLDKTYLTGYNNTQITIKETEFFRKWIKALKDKIAKSIINARIRRLSFGNKGDAKNLGDGIFELRVDYGPGYRVYFTEHKNSITILLCGGDKSTQTKDIIRAKQIASKLEVKHEIG